MSSASTAAREGVAAEVRAAAARKRIKQTWVARELGVSQQMLSRRWTGELPFEVDLLYDVARLLDIPIGDLLPPSPAAPVEPAPLRSVKTTARKTATRNNKVYYSTPLATNLEMTPAA